MNHFIKKERYRQDHNLKAGIWDRNFKKSDERRLQTAHWLTQRPVTSVHVGFCCLYKTGGRLCLFLPHIGPKCFKVDLAAIKGNSQMHLPASGRIRCRHFFIGCRYRQLFIYYKFILLAWWRHTFNRALVITINRCILQTVAALAQNSIASPPRPSSLSRLPLDSSFNRVAIWPLKYSM